MNLLGLVFRGRTRVVRTGVLLCLLGCAMSVAMFSQSKDAQERKVVTRVEPKYPPTLERMYIGGVVRLQVEITADGAVEGAQVIGGNPILGQAAIIAVKQWKYAPATSTRQSIPRPICGRCWTVWAPAGSRGCCAATTAGPARTRCARPNGAASPICSAFA